MIDDQTNEKYKRKDKCYILMLDLHLKRNVLLWLFGSCALSGKMLLVRIGENHNNCCLL